MKISAILKDPGKRRSSVFFLFSYSSNRYKIYTGITVDVKRWSISKQRMKDSDGDEEALKINAKLTVLKFQIIERLTNENTPPKRVKDVCKSIVKGQEPPKKYLSFTTESADGDFYSVEKLEDVKEGITESKETIKELIEKYIKENETYYSDGRIRHYRSVINKLKKANLDIIPINEFNKDHFSEFRNSMIKEGLLNDTINAKIKLVKTPIKAYYPDHKALHFRNIKLKQLQHPILTEDELEELKSSKKITLQGLIKVRDIFMFSCYTGQRISDIFSLRKSDISENYWLLRQQKTRIIVKIPLIPEAIRILEKYDYSIPSITDQVYNRQLKKMLKKADITRPVYLQRESGNKEKNIESSIDEIISSHDGRRIFITHNLNRGVPVNVIAQITGQTIQTLQKYVQKNDDLEKYFLKS